MRTPWEIAKLRQIRVVAFCMAAAAYGGLTTPTTHAVGTHRETTARYDVYSLHPRGKVSSSASDINDRGWITGSSTDAAGLQQAYLYVPGRGYSELGTLGGSYSVPTRINRSGQVVGMSETADGTAHGFSFTFRSGMIDLNELLGYRLTSVNGLNDSGAMTGTVNLTDQFPGPFVPAFLYHPDRGLTWIPTASTASGGVGINNDNDVALYVGRSGGPPNVYTRDGELLLLNLTGGYGNGVPTDMNDSRQIVGSGSTLLDGAYSYTHGHVYTPGDRAWDLGTLGGLTSSALRINDQGSIVGASSIPGTTTTHAFLYTAAERMVDLNTLIPFDTGWELTSATALNRDCSADERQQEEAAAGFPRRSTSCGEIVGIGVYRGQPRGFLLIPKR
jgi:probable HAF family extracellular repeat protein